MSKRVETVPAPQQARRGLGRRFGGVALLAAGCAVLGCGGSADGASARRSNDATSSASSANASSSGASQSAASAGAVAWASNAPAANAMAAPLPTSVPPPSYPPIVGQSPPPADPGPAPSPAATEPPRPTTPAPAVVVVPPNDCRFEYLGDWVRCENAGWPNVTVASAPDLIGCMQECLGRDDCTGVTDYFWLGIPDLGCFLYTSTCDAPVNHPVWAEEDGGRDYRRGACSPSVDAGP